MAIDPSNFQKLNVADTCSIWNILSSQRLYIAAQLARCYFYCTNFVYYECLHKPRKEYNPEDIELQNRLRQAIKDNKIKTYHLDIRPLAKVPSSMRKLGESEGMYELPTGKKPEARGFQTLEWSTSRDFYSNAGGSAIAYSAEKENWQTRKTQLGRPIIDDIGVLERVPYLFSYWSVMGSK